MTQPVIYPKRSRNNAVNGSNGNIKIRQGRSNNNTTELTEATEIENHKMKSNYESQNQLISY